MLAEKLANLSPKQRAALELRLLARTAAASSGIPRQPRTEATFSLSPAQQRLWFLDQLEDVGAAYHLPTGLRLRGPLDLPSLSRALDEVVRRHESLRTIFLEVDGVPRQQVLRPFSIPVPVVDLTPLPAARREEWASSLAAQEAARRFRLAEGPLLRVLVLRLGDDDHLVLATQHHIVSDAWSIQVFLRELQTLYAAVAAGRPRALPELPIQYVDFTLWQLQQLEGEALQGDIEYWRRQLAGAPQRLELATDRPLPSIRRRLGAALPVAFDLPLTGAVRAFASDVGATPFVILLSAFQALLGRSSDLVDVCVGTPVSGRDQPEIEGLIGFFVNSLVIRTDLSSDPPSRQLAEQVRDTFLEAFAHRQAPFEKVVDEVNPERSRQVSPLFQVLFSLYDPTHTHSRNGSEGQLEETHTGTAKFDLSLTLVDRRECFQGILEYDAEIFDATTIGRLAQHLTMLLERIAGADDRPLSQIPLLTPSERHQILKEWNATQTGFGFDGPLHGLFEAQVERTPEAVALVFEGERLSYRELDRRANRLARHLRSLGVGTESLVGLCAHRSMDMVIALLGILKAGGAYVPLDPEYPAERLAFMVEDSGMEVLLASPEAFAGVLAARSTDTSGSSPRVVPIDALAAFPIDTDRLLAAIDPDQLAYVIYTSGSTGLPKGIGVRHSGVVNFLGSMARQPGLDASDVMLAVTTVSFDIAVLELFLPLAVGARVELAGRDTVADGNRLAALIESSGATAMQATPATWRMLLETGWQGKAGLKALCGGEALLGDLARELLARVGDSGSLWNLYGPTETTVWSALQQVTEADSRRLQIPIGRPIGNTVVHLLDRSLEPVPAGIPGELYIGGEGLARGYLRRPDLTAERFVPDRLGALKGRPGARLYRSGDLARYLPDGALEFLGRIDHQVKVRGFRIEPREIEAALLRVPGVRETVVLAREDRPNDRWLVAYVTVDGEAPQAQELREALGRTVPAYMVPAAFVFLERLPLTPNGKVDRRALPAPALQTSAVAEEDTPRSLTEEFLASIWCEFLGLERVGIRDNFFELGGHSLIASRVVSRIRRILAVEVPLAQIFETPTIDGLAKAIREKTGVLLPPISAAVAPDGPLPLSFGQQRLWFLHQLEPDNTTYNLLVVTRITGFLDVAVLAASFTEIRRRHSVLRTIFPTVEGRPEPRVVASRRENLPVIDLQDIPDEFRDEMARHLIRSEGLRPFNLSSGPLLRLRLLRLTPDEHLLVLAGHHIVADEWSLDLLFRELGILYEAYDERRPSPLPELEIQYADFARWQRTLETEVLPRQLVYWRQQLAGAQILDLATDRPRPKLQSGRGARAARRLGPALGTAVRQLGARAGTTPFALLLAVFAILLQRKSGQDDIVVGTPAAQRHHEEIEPLIGFFLNLLVLRLDLAGRRSFREHLKQVSQVVLQAQGHQDLPFERLVEDLDPERTLGRTPLFQVLFTLLNRSRRRTAPEGLRLQPVETETTSSKYDLSLFVLTGDQDPVAQLEYSTDLFDATTMERLLRQLEALLTEVLADPDRPVGELSHLTPGERHQLLYEICDRDARFPDRRTLPELFAASAERASDALAVTHGNRSLTYGELLQYSRHLARRLRAAGVSPETPVGLCSERGLEMVIGLWGILAAGGAYLPLDPSFPDDRLDWMIENSRVPVILSQRHLRPRLQSYGGAILFLDEEEVGSAPAGTPGDMGDSFAPDAGQLAYILYTSGSTGRPKGVQITHRSVVNFLTSFKGLLGFGESDVWLAVTTLSFDISVLELMLPWMVGGHAVLVGPEVAADGARLAEEIAVREPTAMQATPATWQLLLHAGWEGKRDLQILCGGEALPPGLARELVQRGCHLWNLFGPTETTVWSTARELRTGDPALLELRVPVGRPIANTSVFVCGRDLELAAIGEPGELYLGGEGLSRGYLGRPDETAAKFVPDPFSGEAGARLYQSGDLVRMLADGEIDVVGRLDHQIKLRGFRIELGEIERVLEEHVWTREAVALLREDAPGDRRLVAYVVPSAGVPEPPAEGADPLLQVLEACLRNRLPPYMMPSHLVRLEALPRTPNGKLDRRALPAPVPQVGAGLTAPRTPIEERLAEIWAEILKLEQVDCEASFFDLGGHSLTATEMMYRVRTIFGVEIPLPQLFDTPTVAGLAVAIARAKVSSEGSLALPEVIVPDSHHRFEPFPLNEVQQAYWIGRQSSFELGNIASHSYMEIDLAALDVKRLERAMQRLIARHDMLRAIVLPDGRQQILPEIPPWVIPVQDLSRESPARARVALQALRDAMSHEVLSLDRPPLLDLKVSLLADDRARLHFSLDYLIADAWSTGILFREIFRLYQDPELELPALELSFRDCVLAQERSRGSDRHRRAEEYWRRELMTLPPAPELPLAQDPAALAQPWFTRHAGNLSRERWQALRERAARAGVTPSGMLLAAFSEVLGAWSKNPRFTLNLTLFNRPPIHPQINDILGDFTVLSLLWVDASRPGSFELRARALQEELWQNMEHREVSGVWVLRELARLQGKAPDAMMPVVFTSTLGQDKRSTSREGREESEGVGYAISQTPQVWLDHQVGEDSSGGLTFNWDAVEDLFPAGLLDDMFGAYCRVLEELGEEEAWQRSSLACGPAAQLALRAMVNATEATVPSGLLHEPFERQARQRPGAAAVIAGERILNYRELDLRATALACRLRDLGVEPNRLVAVVMEKGWEQVVAVLGILKAGAAYLPVDPALPAQRRDYLLEHGEIQVALTQPWLSAGLSGPAGIEWLVVENETPAGAAGPLPPVQSAEDLAYVIFTSGSTGLPKGVMIDHRGALNTIVDINQRFDVGPGDRVLGLSSLSFDLSVYDIFGALGAGATLVLPEESARRDPERWLELMERHGVTVWNSVPTLLEMLVEYCRTVNGARSRQALAPLRRVLLSGDWIPLTLPGRLGELASQAEVISLGGATEASIWSILYPIGEVDASWSSIPYGRPMINQRFHVLGERLEPRPVWVPGELYIGGVGLARGYWRDEEKTRARFFEHPETGERLYRTGDLGRYRADGTIEFLGREDFQVKIRGHRIELGEIETALLQHPAVRASVVAAVGDPRGERRLAGYVVLQEPAAVGPDELSGFLRTKLPEYMVPAVFRELEALPLTANGKVDRAALGKLAPILAPSPARVQEAPRTPLEERLLALWREMLGITEIGLHQSLFELGANSLTAIRIAARIADLFRVEIALRRIFEAPTISGLAEIIGKLQSTRATEEAESLSRFAIVSDPDRRGEPFPLNEVQQAYWVGRISSFTLGQVAAHSYFEVDAVELDLSRLQRVVNQLIARHDMLRAIVLPDGRQKIIDPVPEYEIGILDLRERGTEEVAAELRSLRERLSHQALPTDSWPLFEIQVCRLDDRTYRLHVSFDLLMVDAWSFRILSRELAQLYRDPDAPLHSLELSFRDYVLAERAFKDSELSRRSREYWWRRLPDLPPAPELPMVKSPDALDTARFSRRTARISRAQWRRIRRQAARVGVSPSGVLLSSFAEVLGWWSKSRRFTLNVPTFNRLPLHPQVDDIVGDFTTLTLLAVDGTGSTSFGEFARGVQNQLWDDLEHRYVGGVRILRELARVQKRPPGALMPVVFTSLLVEKGHDVDAETEPDDRSASGYGYGISQTPQVWLDHQVGEDSSGGLTFNWDAVEDLFPAGLLDDMFDAYCRVLEELGEEEAWQRSSLACAPAAQLALRVMVNATEAPVPSGLLHEPFERQARQRPGAAAVISGEQILSYRELDLRATALASRLRDLGVEPNRLVAVVMEKGWEQVVAVLGILKAGAAYLPVDPALPAQRRSYLLEHGEIQVALTQPWLFAGLSGPDGIEWLVVESETLAGAAGPLPPVRSAEDLAYVIFTSGSTGLPKGVMIDHRGALNTIVDINQRFDVGPEDRVLGLSSLSFDLSVYDIFGALGAGATLVLPEESARRDPERWLELMERHGVTVWNSVPTLLEMLVEYCRTVDGPRSRQALAPLRRVLLSGDWIPLTLPGRLGELASQAEVISLGGATEASIWSILYPIGEVDASWSSIPYGRPMINQRFHVLGERLEPRPVWVPGELYIGGVGLARGYWRDEEKTRARFFEHPETGERLYRTGDLGRYRADGTIEFLGREDFQVKIRGHRIELGEIETALLQHPAVRASVVAAVGDPRGERRLAGYVVLQEPAATDPEQGMEGGDTPAASLEWGLARWTAPPLSTPDLQEGFSGEADKLVFKLSEPGLRRGDEERENLLLLRPVRDEAVLATYRHRTSHRQFLSDPLSWESFERFLQPLMQLRLDDAPLPKYRYPSAGSLYPVQVYLHVKTGRVAGLAGGTYYYHPKDHVLMALSPGAEIGTEIHAPVNRSIFESAAFSLFLVGRLDAISPLYAERARDFCLLEAGYMGQLLMESAPENGVGLCPVGGLDWNRVAPFLALEESHQLLHSFLGGLVLELGASESGTLEDAPGTSEGTAVLETAPSLSERQQPILGELDLLEFKLSEPGLRRDGAMRSLLELARPLLDEGFVALYRRRRSHREFRAESIAAERIGIFLSALSGVLMEDAALPKYRYPSAGSLYPVQVYLHVKKGGIEGLEGGTYYYHPRAHRLTLLTSGAPFEDEIHFDVNRTMAAQSAFTLFLISRPHAIRPLYTGQSRDFSLLEAGYMGQLLMTAATDQGLGLCPVGGVHFDRVAPWLALEDGQEFLHAFVGGAIAPLAAEGGLAVAPSAVVSPSGVSTRVSEAELAEHLRRLLPEHMVPAAWCFLKELPLTANGKVDRQALPRVGSPEPGSRAAHTLPRSEMEKTLARIWEEVLGRGVGVYDNLFDLGGTSLDLVRLRNRLLEDLGLDVPLTRFFSDPTVASLAALLSETEPQTARERIEEAQTTGRKQKEALQQRKELMKRRRGRRE